MPKSLIFIICLEDSVCVHMVDQHKAYVCINMDCFAVESAEIKNCHWWVMSWKAAVILIISLKLRYILVLSFTDQLKTQTVLYPMKSCTYVILERNSSKFSVVNFSSFL